MGGEVRESAAERVRLIMQARQTTVALFTLSVFLIVAGLALDVRAMLANTGWQVTTDSGGYQMSAYMLADGKDPYAVRADFAGTEMGYVYPPTLAVALLGPLLIFGPDVTRWLWSAMGAACLGMAVVLASRAFGPPIAWRWTLLLLGVLSISRLARIEIYHGQADLPILILIVVSMYLMQRDRKVAAGIALGACIVVKPFLGALALWMLWRGERRAGVSAMLSSGLMFVMSFAVLGSSAPQVFQSWRNTTSYMTSPAFIGFRDNNAIDGLIVRLFVETPFAQPWLVSPVARRASEGLVLLVLLAVLARVTPFNSSTRSEPHDHGLRLLVEAGVALGLVLAFGPLTEGSHLIFFIPTMIGVWRLTAGSGSADSRVWMPASFAWGLLALGIYPPLATPFSIDPKLPAVAPAGLEVLLTWRVGAIFLVAVLLSARALIVTRRTARGAPVQTAPLAVRAG